MPPRPMHASGGRQVNTGNFSRPALVLGAAVDDEGERVAVVERWQLQGTPGVNVQLLLRWVVMLAAVALPIAAVVSTMFSFEPPPSS